MPTPGRSCPLLRDIRSVAVTVGIVVLAIVFSLCVLRPSLAIRRAGLALDALLAGAERIEVIEYTHERENDAPSRGREIVLHSFSASPAQIQQLRSAFRTFWTAGWGGSVLCFLPHHRVILHHPGGKTDTIEICFLCDRYAVNGSERDLPGCWRSALATAFAGWGMAPKSAEEYEALGPGFTAEELRVTPDVSKSDANRARATARAASSLIPAP